MATSNVELATLFHATSEGESGGSACVAAIAEGMLSPARCAPPLKSGRSRAKCRRIRFGVELISGWWTEGWTTRFVTCGGAVPACSASSGSGGGWGRSRARGDETSPGSRTGSRGGAGSGVTRPRPSWSVPDGIRRCSRGDVSPRARNAPSPTGGAPGTRTWTANWLCPTAAEQGPAPDGARRRAPRVRPKSLGAVVAAS